MCVCLNEFQVSQNMVPYMYNLIYYRGNWESIYTYEYILHITDNLKTKLNFRKSVVFL